MYNFPYCIVFYCETILKQGSMRVEFHISHVSSGDHMLEKIQS